jgi:hypothetical protein
MGKGKSGVWTAIFCAEPIRSPKKSTASISIGEVFPPRPFGLRRNALTAQHKPVVAQAALLAALVAAGSSPALADKGGRGHHRGIPNVNLGLSQFHKAGAGVGPFVPLPVVNSAPGLKHGSAVIGTGAPVSGAAGFTPSHGRPPPGRLDSPGLRLGSGHSTGSPPALKGMPDIVPPESALKSTQPGNGLALGHDDDKPKGQAVHTPSVADVATARIAAATEGPAGEPAQGSGPVPRQLPSCR